MPWPKPKSAPPPMCRKTASSAARSATSSSRSTISSGTYYATEARCTHGLADLADGTLEGDEIECSFHFGAFNVKTGQPTQPPCFIALKTFKTEVRDGQVFVDIDMPAATAA